MESNRCMHMSFFVCSKQTHIHTHIHTPKKMISHIGNGLYCKNSVNQLNQIKESWGGNRKMQFTFHTTAIFVVVVCLKVANFHGFGP